MLPQERTGDHFQYSLLLGLGPQFRLGEIKDEVCTQDIAPTILDFFGVPRPAEYEGRSVLPFLTVACPEVAARRP